MAKTKIGKRGKEHVSSQMERFGKGRLLRTSAGEHLNPNNPEDRKQAAAIFYNEAERGEKRGFVKRTYKGSTRERPRKANG